MAPLVALGHDQLRRLPVPLAGLRRARRRAHRARPAAAVRAADRRHARPRRDCRTALLERPIRAGRLRWRPGLPAALGGLRLGRRSSSPSCRSTRPRTGCDRDAEAVAATLAPGRLGRAAAPARPARRRRPDAPPTTGRRRPRPSRPATTAAPTSDGRADDHGRDDHRDHAAPVPAVPPLPTGLSRPVRIMVVGDSTAVGHGRRDGGLGRRPRRRRPRRRAWPRPGCGFIRDGIIPTDADDGFRDAVPRAARPSGSRTRWRRCTPTPSSGWSRCATSRTACGTTPRARSGRPTTASWPAWSPTTTPRRSVPRRRGHRRAVGAGADPGRARTRATPPSVARSGPLRALRGGAARGRRPPPRAGRPSSIWPRWVAAQPAPPERPDGLHWSPEAAKAVAADFLGPIVDRGGTVVTRHRPGDGPDRRALRPPAPRALVPHRAGGPSGASGSPCTSTAATRDAAPGHLRAAWLAELHPEVRVIEVVHDLPTDFGDETLWQRWIDLFRDHWPFDDGPDVVLLQRPLRRGTGPAPRRRASRRRCRSDERADQRHHDPQRPRRAPGDAGTHRCGRGSRRTGCDGVTAAGGRCGCTAAAPSSPSG